MPTPTPTSGLTLRQLAERSERAFPSYPLVARYFPASAAEDARQRLSRAIDRGDGPGLVIGAPGTGKSMLLQVLATQYHERFDVVLLACARICTRRALLQAVLFELGLPYKSRDEGELRLSLLDHLLSPKDCPAGLLLLVDEAQTFPIALLDELRVLTNLVQRGGPRVRLVLAGSSALEELFAHPELESFSQRLSARCYLAPLGRSETTQFIRAQIAASDGAPDDVFTGDAWDAIFDATDGVPRLVNQLCDRALLFAVRDALPRIDRQTIQIAWADLQQLPTPWETPPAAPTVPATSPVIEFGGLSDDLPLDGDEVPDVILDVELTELDADDDAVCFAEPIFSASKEPPSAGAKATDPFAEEFDEEEVVLDNFAAWDDMFRRETPRVENRRDPGFAALVQAAIEASPVSMSRVADSQSLGPLREFDPDAADTDEFENAHAESSTADRSLASLASDWPPLRLAVVSEPAPLKPIPLVAPATTTASNRPATLDAVLRAFERDYGAIDLNTLNECPELVIEEDPPPRTAKPVRREQYRHLFSRLRSG